MITVTNVTLKENVILEALNYEIRRAMLTSMGIVMVLSIDTTQSQHREQWNSSSKIQGNSQQCN